MKTDGLTRTDAAAVTLEPQKGSQDSAEGSGIAGSQCRRSPGARYRQLTTPLWGLIGRFSTPNDR
ncbi:MAG: hypothetical protein ACKOEO_01025 [Planctomycetaceae bacterium]